MKKRRKKTPRWFYSDNISGPKIFEKEHFRKYFRDARIHDFNYWKGGSWWDKLKADFRYARGISKVDWEGTLIWQPIHFIALRIPFISQKPFTERKKKLSGTSKELEKIYKLERLEDWEKQNQRRKKV